MAVIVEIEDADAVALTADALRTGGVAVFPTDTVYGIGQSVMANPNGPQRLFTIKRRDPHKVVPWLIADESDLERFGRAVPSWAFCLAEHLWPGGLTLVVQASGEVPSAFCSADGTIALRVPNSAFVREVARACGSPLATTSANTSGLPAPTEFAAVESRIVEEADMAVEAGPTITGLSSTVVLCTAPEPVVVRNGAVGSAVLDQYMAFARGHTSSDRG